MFIAYYSSQYSWLQLAKYQKGEADQEGLGHQPLKQGFTVSCRFSVDAVWLPPHY